MTIKHKMGCLKGYVICCNFKSCLNAIINVCLKPFFVLDAAVKIIIVDKIKKEMDLYCLLSISDFGSFHL